MTIDDKISDKKLQYDINREAAKISALSSANIDKYENLTGVEILPFNQRQIIEQAKLQHSPLRKAFEKQTKNDWSASKKTNRCYCKSKWKTLANKDHHKDIYKETFENLIKEHFDKIKELTYEINHDDLTYYFKGDTAKKRVDNFNDGAELFFKKIQSDEMKLQSFTKYFRLTLVLMWNITLREKFNFYFSIVFC